MRFAYADPPYIGQAKRLYGQHPDYAGEVDHAALIERLCRDYPDGWALSASMKSLPLVMRLCPADVLTLAWIKPGVAPPMGDRRHYSWEPVILRGGRRPGPVALATHLITNPDAYAFRDKPASYVIGAKPEAFCHWIFRHAGLGPDDELCDLFPGSGAVRRAWESFTTDRQLAL